MSKGRNHNNFGKTLRRAKNVNAGIFDQEGFEDVCPSSFDAAEAAENRKRKGGRKTPAEKVAEEVDLVGLLRDCLITGRVILKLKEGELRENMKYSLLEMERRNEREEMEHKILLENKQTELVDSQKRRMNAEIERIKAKRELEDLMAHKS